VASKTEIAWAAGLFEGEGSMRITTSRNARCAVLVLGMTDLDVVRKFQAVVASGTVRGPVKRQPGRKPFYVVEVAQRPVVKRTLEAFLPWFGERRAAKARELLAHIEALDERAAHRTRFHTCGHPRSEETSYVNPKTGYATCVVCKRRKGRERMRLKRQDPAFKDRERLAAREYQRRKRAGSLPKT
jgi:hypothetical protein